MNKKPITPIRVAIVGTRGIPNRHGGFERFVELLVDHPTWSDGCIQFVIYGEDSEGRHNEWTDLRKVPCTKNNRPFWYYAHSTFSAVKDCDIILSCGCGISLFSFLCNLKSKKLVVNPDGCEWRRTKWPFWLRQVVHALYSPTLFAADRIVLDAECLLSDMGANYAPKSTCIAYQAPEPRLTPLSDLTIKTHKINQPYILLLARLEPENNIIMALDAFKSLNNSNIECIVVAPTTTNHYSKHLANYASHNIRFLGGIYDQSILNELRSNCIAYIHGHSVGGTNPSLLEALSTVNGSLMCHDNKYNREVAADNAIYFNNSNQLSSLLQQSINQATGRTPSRDTRYHPDEIARRYRALFLELAAR